MSPSSPAESKATRPRKRRKTKGGGQEEGGQEEDGDDEALLMLSMLDDEAGRNAMDPDEEAARKRRAMQRRQRWKKVDHEEDEHMDENYAAVPEKLTNEEPEPSENLDDEPSIFKKNDAEDDFDMFSSSVSPVVAKATASDKKDLSTSNVQHELDYDDAEGYYKPVIGEVISLGYASYKVLGTVGKGVFSTVLKCASTDTTSTSSAAFAIKCVRSNETMAKAAQTEIEILQTFQRHPHPHIVPMLYPTSQHPIAEHKGHTLLVFEYYAYNLRDVLQKFGKGIGLSLVSVRMYLGQLLSALHHLQKHFIVHADIKLDNMLVTDDFGTVKVCDFGSAMDMRDSGNAIPTPYLVSRFYRAPEIVLGNTPAYTMDLWSVAVTIAELFLGRVLFNGTSNNDMLLKIMQVLGPLPLKQIKQHNLACRTYPLPRHFSEQQFLQQATDPVTGKPIQKHVSLQQFPTKPLQSLLLKAKSSTDSRTQVLQLSDLLKKCLALDPTRRISLKDALQHEFFQDKNGNAATTQQST